MAGIPEDDIRRVREASDLVSIAGERVVLRQRGRDFWGCCPFHNEKSPSFKIDPSTQLWHCFGCGEGGDVFSFVMKLDDIGFVDAVCELARRAGIQITEAPGAAMNRGKKARLKEVCNASAEFFHTQLMRGRGPKVDEARSYLA
ncbi:MAG: CHC2 zinc finger domain-containing protein, partial [Slackia isoflavoniconvertens]|nr:CHC2 zinc finger domain-containing protein [Slackia isoflavoniconvertens]